MTTTATVATKAKTTAKSPFEEFFIDQIRDIYWAEKNIVKGLKHMCRAATTPQLVEAFERHEQSSQRQIEIVEQIFEVMGVKPRAKKCEAMEGLLKEAESAIEDTDADSMVRDAALIMAAQKIEHYEIASYGTLRALACHLSEDRVRPMIEEILSDEKSTDQLLTKIAEKYINQSASEE